jgi:hypothetical protein
MASPGIETVPKGGKCQESQAQARQGNTFVDPGNWPNSLAPPRRQRSQVPHTQEQREANVPCWFYGAGACKAQNCIKARRILTDKERAAIPATWINWNLPENQAKKGAGKRQGQWDSQSDRSYSESDGAGIGSKRWNRAPKGGGNPNGEGGRVPGSQPCRFIKNGGECPHGLQCFSAWSHPTPAGPVDVPKLTGIKPAQI